MAIKCIYSTASGIELEDAYINISNISVIKCSVFGIKKFTISANIDVYANIESYNAAKKYVETFIIQFDLDNSIDLLSQTYSFLKNNSSLNNVSDC